MSGVALAALSALAWGASDFLGGRQTTRSSAAAVLLVAHVAGLCAVVPVALLVGRGAPAPTVLVAAALGGVAELVGVAAVYTGLAVAPARIVAPVAAAAPSVPLAVDVVLGERPSGATAVTILVVIVGLVATCAAGPQPVARSSRARGIRLGAVAALGFGMSFVAIDLAVGASGHVGSIGTTAGVVAAGRVTTVLILVAWVWHGERRVPSVADAPVAGAVGLLIVAGDVAFAAAVGMGSSGVASAIATCHTVVTIALARVIQHERLTAAQTGGIATVVGGVAVLAAVA